MERDRGIEMEWVRGRRGRINKEGERKLGRGKRKERKRRFSPAGSLLQMATTATSGPGGCLEETRTLSWSPTWVARAQILGPGSFLPPKHSNRELEEK